LEYPVFKKAVIYLAAFFICLYFPSAGYAGRSIAQPKSKSSFGKPTLQYQILESTKSPSEKNQDRDSLVQNPEQMVKNF
jgi:hypothetical protein